MSQAIYGSPNWTKLWAKLEQAGNVGLDYCINPVLYPKITQKLAAIKNATVVDFGAGTNVLAIQLLFGYAEDNPALRGCKNLQRARRNVQQFIGIEQSQDLVKEAEKYLLDLGYPNSISIKKMDLAKSPLPYRTNSIDLTVSRNFLMHLPIKNLATHLKETARVLKPGSSYLCAILNPDYEERKYEEENKKYLHNGQRFKFRHGARGENGVFYHYFKTIGQYELLFRKNFVISDKIPCRPITKDFKTSHARYYWPNCPMALVYELKKL